MTETPNYSKEYKKNFNFSYWVVRYLSKNFIMFMDRKAYLQYKRISKENFCKFCFAKHPAFCLSHEKSLIGNDMSKMLEEKIAIKDIYGKEISWTRLNNYRSWKEGDEREITIAWREIDGKLQWGITIYKPDDYQFTGEVKEEIKKCGEWIVTHKTRTKKKIYFSKEIGQNWAIKDFERRNGKIGEKNDVEQI
jgi:hypothetical protein